MLIPPSCVQANRRSNKSGAEEGEDANTSNLTNTILIVHGHQFAARAAVLVCGIQPEQNTSFVDSGLAM